MPDPVHNYSMQTKGHLLSKKSKSYKFPTFSVKSVSQAIAQLVNKREKNAKESEKRRLQGAKKGVNAKRIDGIRVASKL